MSEDKKALRSRMKKLRQSLSDDEVRALTREIAPGIILLPEFNKADCILVYADYNHEVGTALIIDDALRAGKKVACPRVTGENMEFYFITGLSDLRTGFKGIPEPSDDCQPAVFDSAVMVMPGLAYDRNMNRLGYGGGYYDRYLTAHVDKKIFKAAVCYDFQIVDDVFAEEHDQKVDVIISSSFDIR